MTYKYVSSKLLISRVLENFNIDYYDWIGRSFEWIGTDLATLGYKLTLVQADEPLVITVKNYKAIIPCSIETIIYISKDGKRLPKITAPDFIDTTKKENKLDTNYYSINNGKLIFGFETGEIKIYYKTFATEYDKETNNHYPLIPDNEKLLEYLSYSILHKMMLRGYKHHTLKIGDVFSILPHLRHVARNGLKRLSKDDLELISVINRTILFDPKYWQETEFNNNTNEW